MTMSNTGGIPSTVDKEISLLKGLRTVQFCTKAEILVIGLHDETDDRGDDQVFEEYMNLVGCWGHGDTAEDIDNIDFDNFACTDGRCPYPDEDTYTRRIQDTKITTCENVFRMPKSKDGIPDLISSIKRRIVQLARDDESAGLQDKYIFDEIHTKEKRKYMCEEFNKKVRLNLTSLILNFSATQYCRNTKKKTRALTEQEFNKIISSKS